MFACEDLDLGRAASLEPGVFLAQIERFVEIGHARGARLVHTLHIGDHAPGILGPAGGAIKTHLRSPTIGRVNDADHQVRRLEILLDLLLRRARSGTFATTAASASASAAGTTAAFGSSGSLTAASCTSSRGRSSALGRGRIARLHNRDARDFAHGLLAAKGLYVIGENLIGGRTLASRPPGRGAAGSSEYCSVLTGSLVPLWQV